MLRRLVRPGDGLPRHLESLLQARQWRGYVTLGPSSSPSSLPWHHRRPRLTAESRRASGTATGGPTSSPPSGGCGGDGGGSGRDATDVERALELMMDTCNSNGESSRALAVLAEAEARGEVANPGLGLLKQRLRALSQLGDVDGCRQAVAAMRRAGLQVDEASHAWLIRAEAQRGENRGGVRRAMKETWGRKTMPATQELAEAKLLALRQMRGWAGALFLLESLAARQQGRAPPRPTRAEAEYEYDDDAADRAAAGRAVVVTTSMINNVLAAMVMSARSGQALSLMARWREGAYGPDPKPDAVSYSHELRALGQHGKAEEALALLMRIRSGELGVSTTPHMYTRVMAAFARDGRLKEALAVHAAMVRDGVGHTTGSTNCLLTAYGRAGRLEDAERVFDDFEALSDGCRRDVVTYNALIDAHRVAGTPVEAGALRVYRQLVAKALAHAAAHEEGGGDKEEEGLWPDAATFTPLIMSCATDDRWPVALYLQGEADWLLRGESRYCREMRQRGLGEEEEPEAAAEADDDGKVEAAPDSASGRLIATTTTNPKLRFTEEGRDARLDVCKALFKVLDAAGVDRLFSAQVFAAGFRWGYIRHRRRSIGGSGSSPTGLRARHNELTIDMHQFSRAMGKAAILHTLDVELTAFQRRCPELPLPNVTIIVGKGRHNPKGEAVVKNDLLCFLESLEPPVHGSALRYNEGRIVLSPAQVRSYVDARCGATAARDRQQEQQPRRWQQRQRRQQQQQQQRQQQHHHHHLNPRHQRQHHPRQQYPQRPQQQHQERQPRSSQRDVTSGWRR